MIYAKQVSFTFILPLFPSLLEFYQGSTAPPSAGLSHILSYLNQYKKSFAAPISEKYDIILLGGMLGSLFSFLQAIASPIIGRASDMFGRRRVLLWCMCGNVVSVTLWCFAVEFRIFLLSRIVGGLSEGNVQLATAIATDISTHEERASTMALVGVCFSVAFILGPALGATLASVSTFSANPFATAAGGSLALIVAETLYLYLCLPETAPIKSSVLDRQADEVQVHLMQGSKKNHTNPPYVLNLIHLVFLLAFSGMEFSLPFLITSILYPTHPAPAKINGRLLGFIGLIAAVLQGSVVRRLTPLVVVRSGVVSATLAFVLLAQVQSTVGLYCAAALLAITSSTVVTGLNSLASFESGKDNRGEILGALRSWGQLGRALGPLLFCTLFWGAGRESAYVTGSAVMLGVALIVFVVLKPPKRASAST